MSRLERIVVLILLAVVLALFGIKVKDYYLANTRVVAAFGGSYKEATVGELRYLNPILATSDSEKSVSSLIFSSLFKFDKSGNVIPDVAEKFEISADKLIYTITLKDNIYFHDGEKMTADDVVYTVETIQDPEFKSPLYEAWKDIKAETTGENIVTFKLQKEYGPFIYVLDFGILPSYLSPDDLSRTVIGSGPFQYDTVKKNGDKITQLKLESNAKYYFGRPFINNLELDFFDTKDAALAGFNKDKAYQSISGVETAKDNFSKFSFSTSKQLVLVPNLRSDKLKDKAFRAQILSSDQKMPEKVSITLTTANSELQRNKAEELKKSFADRNIDLIVKYYKPVEMKDVLDQKKYELLLFGFDFGHDRDPYIFWHSSQISAMNYAGYSDKNSDILLEDARMITDASQRNAKYDQFYATISSESLAIYYEPVKYYQIISNTIKGMDNSLRCDNDSKYLGVAKWYIKEKRVNK